MKRPVVLVLLVCLILSGCALPAPIDPGSEIIPGGTDPTLPVVTPTTDSPVVIKTGVSASTDVPVTQTPALTSTPNPTNTPPPPTLTPTPDPHVYIIQPGAPLYSSNIFHPDLACQWTGIAGQVFGPDMKPVDNIVVAVTGQLNGMVVNLVSVTGSTTAIGEGGYELTLGTAPADTVGSLWVQLFDMQGNEISASAPLITHSGCDQALAIVNFVHVQKMFYRLFLPMIANANAVP
jgi:hypothetical protein